MKSGYYYISSATIYYTAIVFWYGNNYGYVLCGSYGFYDSNFLQYYKLYNGAWTRIKIDSKQESLNKGIVHGTGTGTIDLNDYYGPGSQGNWFIANTNAINTPVTVNSWYYLSVFCAYGRYTIQTYYSYEQNYQDILYIKA